MLLNLYFLRQIVSFFFILWNGRAKMNPIILRWIVLLFMLNLTDFELYSFMNFFYEIK